MEEAWSNIYGQHTFFDFALWGSLLVILGHTAKVKDAQKLHIESERDWGCREGNRPFV
jgi:hypothetical protein